MNPTWLWSRGGEQRKAHVGRRFGVLAQLVERLNGIEEVRGSIPLGSKDLRRVRKPSYGCFIRLILSDPKL